MTTIYLSHGVERLRTRSDSALKRMKSGRIGIGGMGEWLKPAVLKTVSGVTRSGVRIPLPPPSLKNSLAVICDEPGRTEI
jgi:hypothetical protein